MGDAGEGLVDSSARIQERMEELALERSLKGGRVVVEPELQRAIASLRMARADLEGQLNATTFPRRKTQLTQALEEVDRRIAETTARMTQAGG